MKRRFSRVSVILLLCVFLLSGCKANTSPEDNVSTANNEQQEQQGGKQQEDKQKAETDAKDGDTAGSSKDHQSVQEQPPVTFNIRIYTLDSETFETKAIVASLSEDTPITADLIVQLVVSDIADKSFAIDVNEVSTEDGIVIVDFSSATPPAAQVDQKVEGAILDAVASSVLDNVPECRGVVFRADGKAYTSEHISLGLNQIYMSK